MFVPRDHAGQLLAAGGREMTLNHPARGEPVSFEERARGGWCPEASAGLSSTPSALGTFLSVPGNGSVWAASGAQVRRAGSGGQGARGMGLEGSLEEEESLSEGASHLQVGYRFSLVDGEKETGKNTSEEKLGESLRG